MPLKKLLICLSLLLLLLAACQSSQPQGGQGLSEVLRIEDDEGQLPKAMPDKTNVAFVYAEAMREEAGDEPLPNLSSHELGRLYLETHHENIHTVALEVPQGDSAEELIGALAEEGFEVIFTTSFDDMDATAKVATDYPESVFINISGHKKAEPNFGNLFGAMEEMKYLAGMVAGAKAAKNASNRIGIIATGGQTQASSSTGGQAEGVGSLVREAPSRTPTVAIRLSNAIVLGMKKSCPQCIADIRWISSAQGATKELAAAQSLMDEGAGVLVASAGRRTTVEAVAERGLAIIVGEELPDMGQGSCQGLEEYCLAVTYWNWGPRYLAIVNQVEAGSWVAEDFYGTTQDGMLGLYGFMEGQLPYSGVPEAVILDVQALLAEMEAGRFTRFDMFQGPLKDNQGELIVSAGKKLKQPDLQGFTTQYLIEFDLMGHELCIYCMDFLVEGFVSEAFIPQVNRTASARTGAEAEADEAGKVALREVVEFWTTDNQPERLEVYRAVAARYMAANPNIELLIEPASEAQLIPQLTQAAELPDIVRLGIEQVPVLVANGLLDQLASEAVIDQIGADQFQEGLLKMVTDPATSHYAAVPYDGWVQALWYRKDLFDELELPRPTTWEAIVRANRTLASADALHYGMALGTDPTQNYGHQLFEQVAISAGAYPFDADGKVTMNTPEMIQALKWYSDLQTYALPDAQYWRGAREAYQLDQTGMLFYSTYIMDDLIEGSTLEDGGQVEIAIEELAQKSGFAAQIVGPAGSATYGQLVTLGIMRDAEPAATSVVEFFLTEGYPDIIALAPFGKIPVLKGALSEWKASNDYFAYYSEETLDEIATGYSTMQRWVLRADYDLTERAVIGDLENNLLIPQVLYQITIQDSMTPESGALFLQEEVEKLLIQRLGE